MTEAYPLQWPLIWKRTLSRKHSPFKVNSSYRAAKKIHMQLKLLGGTKIVVSSNVKLRLDGLPYSDQRHITDPGVAAYFDYNGRSQCIPCDKWTTVEDNMWAIAKSVEAMRGLERWGSKEIVNAAFSGFMQIEHLTKRSNKRYFDDCVDIDHVKERFKKLAIELHPDAGGDVDEFSEMNRQYQEAFNK